MEFRGWKPINDATRAILGVAYFQRPWGFEFATSHYSAMPGGLQDMLALGEEAGGDVRALSLIHATRVLLIVVSLPLMLEGNWQVDLSDPPGVPACTRSADQLIWMVVAGLSGWQIAKRACLFGASLIGPMIAVGGLKIAGILEHRPPTVAI